MRGAKAGAVVGKAVVNTLEAIAKIESERAKLKQKLERKLKNWQDAEDVIQNMYVRLLSSSVSDVRNAFIYGYVTALRLDWEERKALRNQAYHVRQPFFLNAIESPQLGPEALLFASLREDFISERLSIRTEKCYRVYRLHRIEGFKYLEIAECVQTSESNVKKLLRTAETVIEMDEIAFQRAKALYGHARADRIRLKRELAKAEAEELRRATELSQLMRRQIDARGTHSTAAEISNPSGHEDTGLASAQAVHDLLAAGAG